MNTFDVGRKQLTDKPIIPVVDTRYLKQIPILVIVDVFIFVLVLVIVLLLVLVLILIRVLVVVLILLQLNPSVHNSCHRHHVSETDPHSCHR